MPTVSNWTDTLSRWMADVQCPSWAQLQRTASLSRHRISQLRQCQLSKWPLQALQHLCLALNISLVELLIEAQVIESSAIASSALDSSAIDASATNSSATDANTAKPSNVEETKRSQQASPPPSSTQDIHRQATLKILEPLLRQLPTAAYAVRNHNLPAVQLLKVLQPLDTLLEKWDAIALGKVGQVVPFDPTWQSPLTDTEYERDTPVSIRYVGYRVGRRTWLKAQVRAET